MNLDLFNANTNATEAKAADAAASVAAEAHGDVPAAILRLEKVYRAEIAMREEVEKKLAGINAQLAGVHEKVHMGSIDFNSRHGIDMGREQLSAYVARVDRFAVHELSADGAPFKGSLTHTDYLEEADNLFRKFYNADVRERAEIAAKLYDHHSPVALWREIAKQFDPDAQRKAANQKAAHRIRAEFGMLRGDTPPQMKLVSGRVEIPVRIYARVGWKGERQLSSSSGMLELGEALQQAMKENGIETTFGATLTQLARSLGEFSGNQIVSRQRNNLGDGVDVVQGYETFKLYVPQEIANAVNMFLAEYPEE